MGRQRRIGEHCGGDPGSLEVQPPAFRRQNVTRQREIEVGMLLAVLKDVQEHFHDEDIVVIGDTNVLKKDEMAVSAFTTSGFMDLNSADHPTYVTGPYKNPSDRAFVPNLVGNFKAEEFG
jgi:predicted extracellular nuclease